MPHAQTPAPDTGLPFSPARRAWLTRLGLGAVATLGATWPGQASAATAVPQGGPSAHLEGVFGPVFDWPVMPIHQALLPDGRVMAFGTNTRGIQSAALNYVVWDPTQGTGADAMLLLPNSTGTDIFCAGQTLMPSGQLLVLGGDRIVNGQRNYANDRVTVFDPLSNQVHDTLPTMGWQRWYATALGTAEGEQLVLGGRIDRSWAGNADAPATVATYATTPELRQADGQWRALTAADSVQAYGPDGMAWYYPRAWVAPDGQVLLLAIDGRFWRLQTAGAGTLTALTAATPMPKGRDLLPSAMVAPGKILSLRDQRQAVLVDIQGSTPTWQATGQPAALRLYGNLTVLADGSAWYNGGSSTGNELPTAHYQSEWWNPATGQWRAGATAQRARLYHSTSLLLPDGSVLSAGGGAPGPQRNLNAELYFPPYLYRRDGSGLPAERPVIRSAPTVAAWGASGLVVRMGSTAPVSRLNLVRAGAVTHNFNNEQRFMSLTFKQRNNKLTFRLPRSRGLLPPGFYLLFALDAAGVPSVAKVLKIDA